MVRRGNKKAQETWKLISIIIAIVVGIMVILGFTQGWGYIFGKIDQLPNDLVYATGLCATYTSQDSFALSYCGYQELTIDGKKGFYNCDYIHDKAEDTLDEGAGFPKMGGCKITAEKYCEQLKENEDKAFKDSTIVNGETCENWGVTKD